MKTFKSMVVAFCIATLAIFAFNFLAYYLGAFVFSGVTNPSPVNWGSIIFDHASFAATWGIAAPITIYMRAKREREAEVKLAEAQPT